MKPKASAEARKPGETSAKVMMPEASAKTMSTKAIKTKAEVKAMKSEMKGKAMKSEASAEVIKFEACATVIKIKMSTVASNFKFETRVVEGTEQVASSKDVEQQRAGGEQQISVKVNNQQKAGGEQNERAAAAESGAATDVKANDVSTLMTKYSLRWGVKIYNLYLSHQGMSSGIEPLTTYDRVTSEKGSSSEEPKDELGSVKMTSRPLPDESILIRDLMNMKDIMNMSCSTLLRELMDMKYEVNDDHDYDIMINDNVVVSECTGPGTNEPVTYGL